MTVAVSDLRIAYNGAFAAEQRSVYPVVDAFEQRMGYAVDRERLESAARVLACPLKKHPPNWQHGRVLYALTRHYLLDKDPLEIIEILDIGTAKGFSALCLLWALKDAGGRAGVVTSVDVLDPGARVGRNTVAELDGYLTLAQTMGPWAEAGFINFHQRTGEQELASGKDRIHVCFIDGKHDAGVVRNEGMLLAQRQRPGDLAVFDDVHLPAIWDVVSGKLSGAYAIERLDVLPHRAYAIGVRRG